MLITKRSSVSGKIHTRDIDVTEEQLKRYREGSECIQDVFSELSVNDREFIKTGITPEEWDTLFDGGDDDIEPDDPDAGDDRPF